MEGHTNLCPKRGPRSLRFASFAVPDVVSFNTAISACAKSRAWAAALGLFRSLDVALVSLLEFRSISHFASRGSRGRGQVFRQKLEADQITFNSALWQLSLLWAIVFEIIQMAQKCEVRPTDGFHNRIPIYLQLVFFWALEVVWRLVLFQTYSATFSFVGSCAC